MFPIDVVTGRSCPFSVVCGSGFRGQFVYGSLSFLAGGLTVPYKVLAGSRYAASFTERVWAGIVR